MKTKKWLIVYILSSIPLLALIAALTIFVDPYFHYHKPHTDLFFYELSNDNERYLNDGITLHFDYDAILTGTSMMENFKSSEFDAAFDCKTIKLPYRGGTLYEINSNQEKAFQNHSVKYIFRSLDYYMLNKESTEKRNHFTYPEYLYNKNLVDDVKYIWNINVLSSIAKSFVKYLKKESGITPFDEYGNWMSEYVFGKKEVLKGRTKFKSPKNFFEFTEQDENRTRNNVQKNIVDIAVAHPETQFYYFLPPYSIAEWGILYENGDLQRRLKEESITVQLLVGYDNIHLFSFNSKTDWILNLDRYKDSVHYDDKINSEMVKLMREDKYRITKENVDDYLKAETDFFMNFDYNSIF